MPNSCLWLEVSNVRTETKEVKGNVQAELQILVQLKGDRGDKEPTWWEVTDPTYVKDAGQIFKALDTKKIVLAGIEARKVESDKSESFELVVGRIRIQFSDSGSR